MVLGYRNLEFGVWSLDFVFDMAAYTHIVFGVRVTYTLHCSLVFDSIPFDVYQNHLLIYLSCFSHLEIFITA